MAVITIHGTHQALRDRSSPSTTSASRSTRAPWSGSWAPTGPARPPPCAPCSGWSPRPPARARIDGKPYRELADPVRHVGAVLEASSFHPGRSARNHLRVVATAAGLPLARADEVLDQVGLAQAARRRVGGFSLGMRQRLGLATALLGDPQVLILDEPANGLDPEGVHWLRGLLRQLADQGRTVLVSSHVLAEVAQTVDQVVIIAAGRLVTQSTLAALTARTDQLVRVRTPKPRPCGRCWPPRASRPTRTGPTSCSRSAPPPRRSARPRRRPGSSSTRWAPSAPTSRTSSSSSPASKEPDHDPSCPRRVHQADHHPPHLRPGRRPWPPSRSSRWSPTTSPGRRATPAVGRQLPHARRRPGDAAVGAALLLGILGMAGEFRHQTVTQTFLVTPDRGRVVAAKLVAYPLAGIALTLTILAFTAAVATGWLAAKGITPSLLDARLGRPRAAGGRARGRAVRAWSGWGSPPWSATRSRPWSAWRSGSWWSRACS